MRKSYMATLVLLVALLTFSTAALAADLDIQPKLELQYIFGKAEYEAERPEDFELDPGFDDATVHGFRFSAQANVWDKFSLAGSLFYGSNDETLGVHEAFEVPEGEEEGKFTTSTYDIAALYNVTEGVDVGAGWLFYGFKAEEYQYKETRDYNGFSLVALVDMPVQEGLAITGGARFAPKMKVKDKVVGHWDDADRKVEAEYDGSYMEAQLGVKYAVYENISIGAGYRYTKLEGDGTDGTDDESDDYHFLDHTYTNSGFYAGVSVSF